MKLKTLLVDDEQHCIDTLSYDLEHHCQEQVDIIGFAQNAIEATAAINKEQPDLMFLDIELPGMSGLDFLETIGKMETKVVFTTAHSKYAVEGYKFNVEGYLLKPVDPDELKTIVSRVYEEKQASKSTILTDKLAIPDAKGIEFITHENIVSCQSSNNYTIIFLKSGEQKLVSKTLKHIESQLPDDLFVRIHHSYLVNLSHIIKYLKSDGGMVSMTNGQELSISKRYKDHFLSLIKD